MPACAHLSEGLSIQYVTVPALAGVRKKKHAVACVQNAAKDLPSATRTQDHLINQRGSIFFVEYPQASSKRKPFPSRRVSRIGFRNIRSLTGNRLIIKYDESRC